MSSVRPGRPSSEVFPKGIGTRSLKITYNLKTYITKNWSFPWKPKKHTVYISVFSRYSPDKPLHLVQMATIRSQYYVFFARVRKPTLRCVRIDPIARSQTGDLWEFRGSMWGSALIADHQHDTCDLTNQDCFVYDNRRSRNHFWLVGWLVGWLVVLTISWYRYFEPWDDNYNIHKQVFIFSVWDASQAILLWQFWQLYDHTKQHGDWMTQLDDLPLALTMSSNAKQYKTNIQKPENMGKSIITSETPGFFWFNHGPNVHARWTGTTWTKHKLPRSCPVWGPDCNVWVG